MSIITLRPSSLIEVDDDGEVHGSNNGAVSFMEDLSDAQILTYVSDGSDLTCVRTRYRNARIIRYRLPTPTIPGGEFPVRLAAFVRWSHGVAGKLVGATVYRAASYPPESTALLAVTGSTVPATSEPMLSPLGASSPLSGWAVQVWMDGANYDSGRPLVWETGATVYTVARATATPQATVMSDSTYPTVPVQVTAAIGWESSAPSWSGLRTVTVELRIESTPGTIVATATQDVLFTVSGTIATPVRVPTSLRNGAYSVYARAIRHRESETTPETDQIGAWSAAAALSMTVTPPATPVVSTSVDEVQSRVIVSVTPPASPGYVSPFVSLERSDDGGTTWLAVRDGSAVPATFGTAVQIVDWEAPRGGAVWYRAVVSAYLSGTLNVSDPSSPVAATVPAAGWNVKLPQDPAASVFGVVVLGTVAESWAEDVGVFRPDDRTTAVTVSGAITDLDGDLTFHAGSAADWAALYRLLTSRAVLRLESPYGWTKWIKIVGGGKVVTSGTSTAPRRQITVSYVTVGRPVGTVPQLPPVLLITVDAGAAATSSWDTTVDAGAAATSSWDGSLDCGAVT